MDRIREREFALDLYERFPDWSGAAVPVYGPRRKPVAAMLAGTRELEFRETDATELALEMKPFVRELSRRPGSPNE